VQKRGRVEVVRPADLPVSALGWSSVSQVVLAGGVWAKLDAPQQEAMRHWVGLGGHLVVMGGAEAAQHVGALPEAMRPAEVMGTRSAAQLRSLGLLDGGPGPRGSVNIAELKPRKGTSLPLPAHEGAPLAVRANFGDGAVTVLAFDASEGPFRQWGGMDETWDALRFSRSAGTAWTEGRPDAQLLSTSVGMLPEFELPSMSWVMLLIGLYIVLVGPVNYQVLKRRRRLDLAWVTIPALTLLATAGTYGMGYVLHGSGLMVYELALVRAVPEAEVAHVYTYVSLFSPSPRAYAIDIEGAQILPVSEPGRASGRVTILQGRKGSVEGLDIDQWSMRGVLAEAVIPWPDHEIPSLRLESNAIVGDITNIVGRDLEDVLLVVPGGVSRLGTLSKGGGESVSVSYRPGSSVQVNPVSELSHLRTGMVAAQLGDSSTNSRMRFDNSRQQVVEIPAARRADALLLGFSDDSILDVEVRDRRGSRRRETLVSGYMPIVLGGEASSSASSTARPSNAAAPAKRPAASRPRPSTTSIGRRYFTSTWEKKA
jgi:hypothetical protein